jgi:hypothetical protein
MQHACSAAVVQRPKHGSMHYCMVDACSMQLETKWHPVHPVVIRGSALLQHHHQVVCMQNVVQLAAQWCLLMFGWKRA